MGIDADGLADAAGLAEDGPALAPPSALQALARSAIAVSRATRRPPKKMSVNLRTVALTYSAAFPLPFGSPCTGAAVETCRAAQGCARPRVRAWGK